MMLLLFKSGAALVLADDGLLGGDFDAEVPAPEATDSPRRPAAVAAVIVARDADRWPEREDEDMVVAARMWTCGDTSGGRGGKREHALGLSLSSMF